MSSLLDGSGGMCEKPTGRTWYSLCAKVVFQRNGVFVFLLGAPGLAWGFMRKHGSGIPAGNSQESWKTKGAAMIQKVVKTNEEWLEILTPEQFRVARTKGTEWAFTGTYHDFKGEGVYACVCCDLDLFSSEAKFTLLVADL